MSLLLIPIHHVTFAWSKMNISFHFYCATIEIFMCILQLMQVANQDTSAAFLSDWSVQQEKSSSNMQQVFQQAL